MLGLVSLIGLSGEAADKILSHSKLRVKPLGCGFMIIVDLSRTNPSPHVLQDNDSTFLSLGEEFKDLVLGSCSLNNTTLLYIR